MLEISFDPDGGAANLDLASNPFYRAFTDSLPVTEQAAGLPDMGGGLGQGSAGGGRPVGAASVFDDIPNRVAGGLNSIGLVAELGMAAFTCHSYW